MQRSFILLALPVSALGAFLAPAASAATDADLSVSVGAEYTSGDYGTSSTTKIWYVPVTFGYETDPNAIYLTVPYVSVEGTGNVVASGEGRGLPHAPTSASSRTESGLGDVLLVASHKIAGTATSRVDLTGKIKFGTADRDKNLGTGEDDYAVQLDAEKSYAADTVYGSGGYKILGDPPGTDYDNVFYGVVGYSHKLDSLRAAGLEFYAQEAALSGTDGPSELTLFLSSKPDRKTKVSGYLLKGFSDGSPDWGVGATLKLIF
jgi:hypothetical protein